MQLQPPLVFDKPIVQLGTAVVKLINMLRSSCMVPFFVATRTCGELIDDDVFWISPFLVRVFLW